LKVWQYVRGELLPALPVNIILFSPAEVELPLPRQDSRARHILEVLRRVPGGEFDAGLINGPRGKATLRATTDEALVLEGMDFVRTDRSDPGYGQSTLWSSHEWEDLLIAGAAQAFCTRLPAVRHGLTLAEAIAGRPTEHLRVALDNYESPGSLRDLEPAGRPAVTLALGAERGWSAAERALLLQQGFVFAHLGERVLRTETACIAAVTLLKAKLGLA
jgi:16S rRNA U1498 N3-methylase RsmE